MDDPLTKKEDIFEGAAERRRKNYIILVIGLAIIIVIIVVVVLLVKGNSDSDKPSNDKDKDILESEISTINFIYNGNEVNYNYSCYNYNRSIIVIYQKNVSNIFYVGIANEDGKITKEIIEMKKNVDIDSKYLRRPSPFSDGKRLFIGGKILECTKQLSECDDATLIDIVFPKELTNNSNVMLAYTDCFINYGSDHLFWSTFDHNMNTFNFVGKLSRKDDKYNLENVQGISNFFYDTYSEENYTLPRMIKYGQLNKLLMEEKVLILEVF